MDQRKWRRGTGFTAIGVIVLLLIGLLWSSSTDPEPASADSGTNYNILVAGEGCNVADIATQATLNRGFKPGQFVIGEDQVDWSAAEANERGEGAFAQNTPQTAEANVNQLAGDDEASRAALNVLHEESGATKEDLLDPDSWIPVQYKVESEWAGNTMNRNGEAAPAGTRKSAAGDVAWLFVHPTKCRQVAQPNADGAVPEGAIAPEDAVTAHRAGCGNPQTELPTPKGGPPPKKPPTTTTTRPGETTTTTVCTSKYCTGLTVTTQAPPPTTEPPRTTTTQPNNGGQGDSGDGATNTTSPPTTQAPAPAPPTTSSPTTNPPPPPG